MTAQDIIWKKYQKQELTDAEIAWLWAGYLGGAVSEAQMASFAMAVMHHSMTIPELATWTACMISSGESLSYPEIASRPLVDKHSTGGVGDKVSLLLAPLLAVLDMRVPMISGRALGKTGGTLDKLEALTGFTSALSTEHLAAQLDEVGCFIASATSSLVPADRRMYALRDETATVASVPLIASSIMSKKIASGVKHLVLDVKVGPGAFCDTLDMARELAQCMVRLGNASGVRTIARLTPMSRLLGLSAGNAVEVQECIDALSGEGPEDLVELTLDLASALCRLAGSSVTIEQLRDALQNGQALGKFRQMVVAQGGKESLDLAQPMYRAAVTAQRSFQMPRPAAEPVSRAALLLGSGRALPTDNVDLTSGVRFTAKPGSTVSVGQTFALVQTSTRPENLKDASALAVLSVADLPEEITPEWVL
jgi:thymidine phosphorylase